MKTIKNFFIGTLLGFIFGGLLGLLLTPQSGIENRQVIGKKYTETAQKVQQAMKEKQDELKQEIDSFIK